MGLGVMLFTRIASGPYAAAAALACIGSAALEVVRIRFLVSNYLRALGGGLLDFGSAAGDDLGGSVRHRPCSTVEGLMLHRQRADAPPSMVMEVPLAWLARSDAK